MQSDPDMTVAQDALRNIKKAEDGKEKANQEFKAGKMEDALKSYNDTIALDPFNRKFNALILGNICSLYLKQKNHKEAMKAITKAIEYDPQYAKAFYKRGELNKEMGDWEGWERDLKRAQNLDPTLNLQGYIKENQNKVKEAKKKDYYKVLGVDKTANDSEIKKAFRKLSIQWHPDKHAGSEDQELAEKKYREIVDAYDV